jgi:hypothetical protein
VPSGSVGPIGGQRVCESLLATFNLAGNSVQSQADSGFFAEYLGRGIIRRSGGHWHWRLGSLPASANARPASDSEVGPLPGVRGCRVSTGLLESQAGRRRLRRVGHGHSPGTSPPPAGGQAPGPSPSESRAEPGHGGGGGSGPPPCPLPTPSRTVTFSVGPSRWLQVTVPFQVPLAAGIQVSSESRSPRP